LTIVGLKQSDSEDERSVLIEGTLRNQGAAPTKKIQVKVDGLDESGRVITTVSVPPTSEVIPPGGSATFATRIANSPAIRKFHIKANFN